MLTMIFLRDVIKTDGYLSHLQQFWLDTIAPLAAILEGGEAEKLMPEHAYSEAQSAIVLLRKTNDHMAQERHKRISDVLIPILVSVCISNNTNV